MAGGTTNRPVSPEVAARALRGQPLWVVERTRLRRDFRFATFVQAIEFVNRVAALAEEIGHHPNIRLHEWCFVELELYSHLGGGLSEFDIRFARALDGLLEDAPDR